MDYTHLLEGAVAAQAGRIACLEQDASDSRGLLAQRVDELTALRVEQNDRRSALEEKESRIEALQAERAELHTAIIELRNDVGRLEQASSDLQKGADESASRLSALHANDERISNLERALELQHASIARLADGLGRLEQEGTALRAQGEVHDAQILSLLTQRRRTPAKLVPRFARIRSIAARLISALRRHGPYHTLRIAAVRIGQRIARTQSAEVGMAMRPPPHADQHNTPLDMALIRASGPLISILTPQRSDRKSVV